MSTRAPASSADAGRPRAAAVVPAPDSSLLLLQKGTGRPVFVCHALSGSAWVALPLIRVLRLARPVYATQAPDLDGSRDVMSLAEMVARYTADIRAIQPRGPYSLIGYSFGAVLAFEIAHRLVAEGQDIRDLVMLDQPAPGTWSRTSLRQVGLRARRLLGRVLQIGAIRRTAAHRLDRAPLSAAMSCLGPGPLTSAELRRIVRLVSPSGAHQITRRSSFERLCEVVAAVLERSVAPSQWQSLIKYAKRADCVSRVKGLKVYTKNFWLARTYRPRAVFPGCIRIYAGSATPVKDWQTFTAHPIQLHTVPTPALAEQAGHFSFIDTPNAALFADDLRRVLERE